MAIGVAVMKYFQSAPSASVVMSTIKVESGHGLGGWRDELQRPSRTAMAISSDSRFVVYSADVENPGYSGLVYSGMDRSDNSGPGAKAQLYLRRMDQAAGKPIAGTEGGINPFLSPDNRWVGFEADRKLKKVPVEGGVPTTLCDTSQLTYIGFFGANWGSDNSIVFSDGSDTGLSVISADGGKPETLTSPDPKREEKSHRLPSWLPNGKAVLFTVVRPGERDHQQWVAVVRLDTRRWQVLLENAADAKYVPTGHLVFLRQGTLMAVRFDPDKLEIIGQPFPLMTLVQNWFEELKRLVPTAK